MRSDSMTPALAAAAFLHLGVFMLAYVLAPREPMALGGAVPVNLVADAPTTASMPTREAPDPQTPRSDTPVDRGNPEPSADTAAPAPVKNPVLLPKPPPRPSPSLARRLPTAPKTGFSLDALAATVARQAAAEQARAGHAPPGPSRARTAAESRPDSGQGISQSDMQGLQQLLERLWNPNCSIEAADAVVVPVKFSVGADGQLVGRATSASQGASTGAVEAVAARRALDAVSRAEPYGAAFRGKSFTVIFDARKACANQ